MDVETLRTLLAIVDHRGFAAAGKAVGLSTSGVSLRVKALEVEFGLELFDRATRPPTLTRSGRAFVERARAVVAGWERLAETLSEDAAVGVLRLGAIPTLVSGILPVALARLRAESPELRIHLTSALSHELEARLERGSLDAALLTQPAEVGAGLTWTAFCSEPLMVVAPEGAPGGSDREILAASPFIRFKRYAWAGRLIDDELRRRGIEVTSPMEVDSLEGILELVAAGLGVSVVPRRNLLHPFPPGVRAVPFGDPPVTRSLGVLQRLDNPRGRFVHQLYDALARASETAAA